MLVHIDDGTGTLYSLAKHFKWLKSDWQVSAQYMYLTGCISLGKSLTHCSVIVDDGSQCNVRGCNNSLRLTLNPTEWTITVYCCFVFIPLTNIFIIKVYVFVLSDSYL